MESCDTFEDAATLLRSSLLVAPAFVALSAGCDSKGSIFTFGINAYPVESALGDQRRLLAVANLDLEEMEVPVADGDGLLTKDVIQGESLLRANMAREQAAGLCGSSVDCVSSGLRSVLCRVPVSNEATLHHTLMNAATDLFENERHLQVSWMKELPDPSLMHTCVAADCEQQTCCWSWVLKGVQPGAHVKTFFECDDGSKSEELVHAEVVEVTDLLVVVLIVSEADGDDSDAAAGEQQEWVVEQTLSIEWVVNVDHASCPKEAWPGSELRRRGGGYYCDAHLPL